MIFKMLVCTTTGSYSFPGVSPMHTGGSHCWQRPLMPSAFQEKTQTGISTSCTIPLHALHTLGQPLQGCSWFCLFTNELRPVPTCIKQTKLTTWAEPFSIKGNFFYKRWPPYCLSGTQIGLLPESVSPKLQLFCSNKCFLLFITL